MTEPGLLGDMPGLLFLHHTVYRRHCMQKGYIMQTFLVHEDPYMSAKLLDQKRRFSQIYEGIHILASLTQTTHLLVNPKRNVANHPVAKLWSPYPGALLHYCVAHFSVWRKMYPMSPSINAENLAMLSERIVADTTTPQPLIDLIPYYQRLLFTKDPRFYREWRAV